MTDVGCLVLPVDLVFAVLEAPGSSGWFRGASIDSEHVFVATEAELGVETKRSVFYTQLMEHRAFQAGIGERSEKLFRWVRVTRGSGTEVRDWRQVERAKLEAAFGGNVDDGASYVCTFESTDKTPRIRPLHVLAANDSAIALPLTLSIIFPPTPYARLPKELVENLAKKRVAIVGTGSGGAEIVLQLASTGLGSIAAFDGDRLEQSNYIRHILSRGDVGRTKVDALKTELMGRDLPTEVQALFEDVLFVADEFRKQLSEYKPDLLICATDSRESRRFINYCAVHLNIPLLIAGLIGGGRIGEVLFVSPRLTACYECVRTGLGALLEKPDSEGRNDAPYVGGEPQDMQSAVYRFDVSFIAGLTARVAMHVLEPTAFPGFPTNYLAWGREASSYPPPFNFEFPFTVNYVPIPKRPACPVCGDASLELRDVDISSAFSAILSGVNEVHS
jgi:hypothetical protein